MTKKRNVEAMRQRLRKGRSKANASSKLKGNENEQYLQLQRSNEKGSGQVTIHSGELVTSARRRWLSVVVLPQPNLARSKRTAVVCALHPMKA